ncbi:hypothetical protein CSA37_06160 [Candidatus Fermentibacteria bacterium]|nr:MAG: hypothetical protein CSA37_06160 [Candidatus Fermentibacteria bacterium]
MLQSVRCGAFAAFAEPLKDSATLLTEIVVRECSQDYTKQNGRESEMAKQIDCPSCGAAVKYSGSSHSALCKYCGNTVVIPPEMQGQPSSGSKPDYSGCGKSMAITFSMAAVIFSVTIGIVFYTLSQNGIEEGKNILSLTSEETSAELEFGGTGTGPGYFTDPQCIAADRNGNIFVGEMNSGRIQVFDQTGEFSHVWYFAEPEEFYLGSIASDGNDLLYMVYDSELYIHDSMTGELLGNLRHPDGWGFSDVDTAPDGDIIASWYCNRDDLVVFSGDKAPEVIHNAVSGVTGDSELNAIAAAGNSGEKYILGSFNSVVVVYDSSSSYADRFGSDEVFTMPVCMDVDPRGNIWVSDFGELLKFSPSGELLNTIVTAKGINDFVIDDNFRLWGISYDHTIVMIDLSEK